MKPAFTILLPHLREPNNDAALKICLDCIVSNTSVNYELIIESVAERRDIYRVLNKMAERASTKWIVFHNSDVFVAPGWAEPLLAAADETKIITGVIVECGAIGVNVLNHHRNFGMTPETFRRGEFERWVKETPEIPDGDGWYFPSLHNRHSFLDMGGFDTHLGTFPDPLDIDYWNRWREAGYGVRRVPSFCYHLQFWSSESEQTKAVRRDRD